MDIIADDLLNIKATTVIKEQTIATPSGTLKPVLVIIDEGRIDVANITVHLEEDNNLERADEEKTSKYKPLVTYLAQHFNLHQGKVYPITLGTRDAVPHHTCEQLKELNKFKINTSQKISLNILISSIEKQKKKKKNRDSEWAYRQLIDVYVASRYCA